MNPAVFQVRWTPGSDQLLGVCHCGAEHLAGDPIEAWAWLLAHPDGHAGAPAARVPAPPREPVVVAVP